MESKNIILKALGAVVFICGGLIGGAVNVPETWVSKLPALLGVAIAISVCSLGVFIWKSSNLIDENSEEDFKDNDSSDIQEDVERNGDKETNNEDLDS